LNIFITSKTISARIIIWPNSLRVLLSLLATSLNSPVIGWILNQWEFVIHIL